MPAVSHPNVFRYSGASYSVEEHHNNSFPQLKLSTPAPRANCQAVLEEPDLKPSYKFNAENVVTLLIGPDEQKMVVHTSYLARTSDFFATALKQVWLEGQTRTIKLYEETPELMAHYLNWIYSSELPTKDCSRLHLESAKIAAHDLLAELYVLGERRLDSDFRNAITAEFIRLTPILHVTPGCQPSRRVRPVNAIYHGTPAGSPARRLLVHLHASHARNHESWYPN